MKSIFRHKPAIPPGPQPGCAVTRSNPPFLCTLAGFRFPKLGHIIIAYPLVLLQTCLGNRPTPTGAATNTGGRKRRGGEGRGGGRGGKGRGGEEGRGGNHNY